MAVEFRFIAAQHADPVAYRKVFSDAVVFTHTGALLLQRRPANWGAAGGKLTLFGGHAEAGETPVATICRELHEELGARVTDQSLVCIGVIEEHEAAMADAVFVHIYVDRNNSITGCYEGTSEEYRSIDAALMRDDIMPYARLALEQARTFLNKR